MMDMKKEWWEAQRACDDAIEAVEEVKTALKSASTWGTWDLIGGDFLSGLMKYRKMDRAKEAMEKAQDELKRLSKELNDIEIPLPDYELTGNTDRMFDLFFDNIYHDWKVRKRIQNNLEKMEELGDNLRVLRLRLDLANPFNE